MGSPPPARGAHPKYHDAWAWSRITPARAGSTHLLSFCNRNIEDHPRPRGEHNFCIIRPPHTLGSPPPARGAPLANRLWWVSSGITPARAGSTLSIPISSFLPEDHPRPRGEHFKTIFSEAQSAGSPPPARGARCQGPIFNDSYGITPARAGSTFTTYRRPGYSPDHPRPRGEHVPLHIDR